MGTFAGHVYEASFTLSLAVWWMYKAFPAYLKAFWHGELFYCRASYTSEICNRTVPTEAIFKSIVLFTAFMLELTLYHPHFVDENNRFMNVGHLHHLSIFGLFFLYAFIDLLAQLGAPLPRGFDMLSGALAFAWYGISFGFHAHMHGKEGMEQIVHLVPTYAIYAVAICMVIETVRPSWFLAHVVRIYCLMVVGSWFIYSSFVMYDPLPFPGRDPNPKWNRTDMNNVEFLVAAFGFCLMLNLVFMVVFYLATLFILKARGVHRHQFSKMAHLSQTQELL